MYEIAVSRRGGWCSRNPRLPSCSLVVLRSEGLSNGCSLRPRSGGGGG